MNQGVHLKERRMVKWSDVGSPEEAGQKLARFYFPITREFGNIYIEGQSPFAENFFKTFEVEGLKNSGDTQYFLNTQKSEKSFSMIIRSIDDEYVEGCKQGDRLSCTAIKAKKKFLKKERDLGQYWINMYRLTIDQAVLFYKDKENR